MIYNKNHFEKKKDEKKNLWSCVGSSGFYGVKPRPYPRKSKNSQKQNKMRADRVCRVCLAPTL